MSQPIADLLRDLRYAARMLIRTRGFTLTAIAVLAVGIGANTAVFSVVNVMLLRPLPYPESERLFQIVTDSPIGVSTLESVPRFNIWRSETRVFQALAAYQVSDPGVNLTEGGSPERLAAMHVSRDYFEVFGAALAMGRTFTVDEDRPHGAKVTVLSHRLWTRRFGRDPGMVGKTISLGDGFYEVVGVAERDVAPDPIVDLWLPLQVDPFSLDQAKTLHVVGRLRPDVTPRLARFQVAQTTPKFRSTFPLALGPLEAFTALPLQDVVVGNIKPILGLLTGAVFFVLLIACANIANLLLARGHRRRREIATRTALGASRWRIVSQLLTESLLLAIGGGIAGLFAGDRAVRALAAFSPIDIPRMTHDAAGGLDANVLFFSFAIAIFTGVVFGVVPAFESSKVDLTAALKDSGSASDQGWRRHRGQAALVVGEVTLALVLLVGSGLLIKTVMALRGADRGVDPRNVLTLDLPVSGSAFERTDAIARLEENARLRLAGLPGVEAVAVARALPIEPTFAMTVRVDKTPTPVVAGWRSISPQYFDVYRIRLVLGRRFTEHDTPGALPVVIINAALARKMWNRNDPIGGRLTIGTDAGPWLQDVPRHVVGVVADVRETDASTPAEPVVYVPLAQVGDALSARNNRLFPLTWSVRTSIEPRTLVSPIAREITAAAGGLPVARTRTIEEILAASTARTTFTMALLTAFAAVALLLAVIGLYGLMSYSVEQRAQEIGIRMALGAEPGQVRRLVLVEGLRLAIAGVVCGAAAALVLTRLMVNLIFGVATWDPTVFLSVATLLSVVALIAVYVPAARATRIQPLDALRR